MFTNARGIRSKKCSLNEIISIIKPDIVCITETHLVGKCSFSIENYDIIQRNRSTKGGGILVAVNKSCGIEYTVTKIDETAEQLWIKCKDKNWSWRIATVYGLQESQVNDEETEQWFYNLERELATCSEEPLLIVGDFNAHVGNDESGINGNNEKINRNGKKIRELIERRNLTLLNSTELCKGLWTRVSKDEKSIIDLAICNEPMLTQIHEMVVDEERQNVISRVRKIAGKFVEIPSDHNTITITIEGDITKTNTREVIWNVSNERDQQRFNKITETVTMHENWNNFKDINKKYKRWSKQVKSLMHQCFQRTTIKPGQNNKMTRELINQKRVIKKKITKLEQQNEKDSAFTKN